MFYTDVLLRFYALLCVLGAVPDKDANRFTHSARTSAVIRLQRHNQVVVGSQVNH